MAPLKGAERARIVSRRAGLQQGCLPPEPGVSTLKELGTGPEWPRQEGLWEPKWGRGWPVASKLLGPLCGLPDTRPQIISQLTSTQAGRPVRRMLAAVNL